MKINKINILILAVASFALTSCMDDDLAGMDALPKPTATTSTSSLTLAEGESGVITFTIDRPIGEVSQFKIDLAGNVSQNDVFIGDQEKDADTGIPGQGFEITVPAFATSFDIPVDALNDVLAEGTETATLNISAAGVRTILLANGGVEVNLSISNVVDPRVALEVDFDQYVDYTTIERNVLGTDLDDEVIEHTESLCDLADFDIFLSTFDAYAFSADCPEVANPWTDDGGASILSTELADGTYGVYVDLWSFSLGLNLSSEVNEILKRDFLVPITVKISHVGTFNSTIELPGLYASNSPTSSTSGGAGEMLVATLEVSGGNYIVYDAEGNLIAQE